MKFFGSQIIIALVLHLRPEVIEVIERPIKSPFRQLGPNPQSIPFIHIFMTHRSQRYLAAIRDQNWNQWHKEWTTKSNLSNVS